MIAVVVALLAALAAGGGVWLAQRDGEVQPAASGVTSAPSTPPGTTSAPQGQTMKVRVFFHEQAPGPEADPGKVVPVSRTVPRSPKVATAALTGLLGGPTAQERAAGYWSFFTADTAGMLRSVRVTGGTALADFRDFRRLMPNATSSYGSTALLAELDATLKQFPTVRRTLYAFNGDVAAFYEWLQLEVAFPPSGGWRSIATAPISGRDGPAAVWTGRQLLVWGGHDRSGSRSLRPLRDGAAYDPASDRWQPIPSAPTGVQRTSTAAVWTGLRMLVWDASATGHTSGALYDPARDRWAAIRPGPALGANHSGPVWTGTQLIAWSGWSTAAASPPYHDGAAYRPVTST